MDNLYLDKLKGRSDYDRFYQSLHEKKVDTVARLEQLQDADDNYHMTAQYVLTFIQLAHELFISSEVEERRQSIKLVLSNLELNDEIIVYKAHEPLDLIINSTDRQLWRG